MTPLAERETDWCSYGSRGQMQRRCRANGKWEDMGFQARDSRPDRTETEPCLVLLSRADGLCRTGTGTGSATCRPCYSALGLLTARSARVCVLNLRRRVWVVP